MLIIDGVKYKLWTPDDEEDEFHPMIRACSKEIFGDDSLYFDIKNKLVSISGIGSIPDAYAITLSEPFEWYVIENELASHPIYDHIVKQLTKFINGLKNPKSRKRILEALDEEVKNNEVHKARIEKKIDPTETYRFLSNLILERYPKIVVIIDELNEEVKEACQSLKYDIHFVEFKTFVKEDDPIVHAHLFEPIPKTPTKKPDDRTLKWRCVHCKECVPAIGHRRLDHLATHEDIKIGKDWKKVHYELNPLYGKSKYDSERSEKK